MKNSIIIGKCPATNELLAFINNCAKSDSNVLILGETGVGKELAAHAIHMMSPRKDKLFFKINCANLNDNLLESELFGHKRGAFTGAIIDKPGLIETADGGTFFLDEIGDISLYLQAKMISVIEDKEIRRIGENLTRKINTRFICATNKNISQLLSKGKFREDLYYRIGVLIFYIAPLRERKEDIPLLVENILKIESAKKSVQLSLTKEALNKLMKHSFPGNVRELENILVRACELSDSRVIRADNIIFHKIFYTNVKTNIEPSRNEKVVNALRKSIGNKTKAAKEMGISRTQLYRLLNM